MSEIDTSRPVLVTGATGYVAGWLVKALLDGGATVHAPVRDPENTDKIAHLLNLAANAPGEITFFKADLLAEGSYAEAMEGCGVVFHTASPFTSKITDPQKDLVDPALNGTRNVLEEANRTHSVTRVVVTSSCAAIYGDNADLKNVPGGVLTEDIWNTSSSLEHLAYSYSKTVAERAAWEIANAQDRWRLVVVNPSFVLGPALQPRPTSESFSLMKGFGDGTFRTGVPRIGIGAVDVRDLAVAHVRAGFRPEAQGRHIISGHNTDFLGLADGLRARYGADYPLPKSAIPKWLAWLVGPMLNPLTTRKYIARNVDIAWRSDNSRSVEALGMSYRPLDETMEDMFAFMIEAGWFKQG